MDLSKYTDLGLFETKEIAMVFRDKKYSGCGCYTIQEKSKTRLFVKLTK